MPGRGQSGSGGVLQERCAGNNLPFCPLGHCLKLGLVTSYWVEFEKGSVEEVA